MIIKDKLNNWKIILYNITKNLFKLELEDCQIFDNLLYEKKRFYVLLNKDNTLYTQIIKEVHIFLLNKYASQTSTYNCLIQ